MLRSIVIGSLSASILGAVYAFITWMLCRRCLARRGCSAIAAGLTVLYHVVAGIVEVYFGETLLSLILFYTITVPWSYGFGIGPNAFWLALLIQTIASTLIAAGICAVLPVRKKEQ